MSQGALRTCRGVRQIACGDPIGSGRGERVPVERRGGLGVAFFEHDRGHHIQPVGKHVGFVKLPSTRQQEFLAELASDSTPVVYAEVAAEFCTPTIAVHDANRSVIKVR
jgi:hypothetical protein